MGALDDGRRKLARAAARLNARNGRELPSLILMTDDTRDVDWALAAAALPRGAAVIVRHRVVKAREALARRLRDVTRARGVKLFIAGDAALAMRVRADGLHLPQKLAGRARAIKTAHPFWLVTASAHDAASARANADAVIVAPVFATASHQGSAALGVVRFAAIVIGARRAYALGGINAGSVQRLAGLPVCGIGLIGGWTL